MEFFPCYLSLHIKSNSIVLKLPFKNIPYISFMIEVIGFNGGSFQKWCGSSYWININSSYIYVLCMQCHCLLLFITTHSYQFIVLVVYPPIIPYPCIILITLYTNKQTNKEKKLTNALHRSTLYHKLIYKYAKLFNNIYSRLDR